MAHLQSRPTHRRGAITPLMAFMLTIIVALLALSVDLGYIALVRTQLQTAADAAALAGASQLMDKSLLEGGSQTTATDRARTETYNFAHNNTAGAVALAPDLNNANTSTGDIVCGYFNRSSDRTEVMSLTPPTGALYNAVQVRVYRDSSHTSVGNGPLSLFFARALGIGTRNLQATATASIQGAVLGFQMQTPGRNFIDLLPYTLKYRRETGDPATLQTWEEMIGNGSVAGTGADNWTRTISSAGVTSVTAGADQVHEIRLFPAVNNSNGNGNGGGGVTPGNFGQVDIGSSNNSTADVKRQIVSGVSSSDLAWFNASHGFPNGFQMSTDWSSPTGYSMILQGDTGISAGVASDFQSIIGQARIIPLYSHVTGNGNNAQYTICKFVGVTILDVRLTGSTTSKHITVQPCFVVEPNTIAGGTAAVSQFVVRPIALVR